jgi:hypothetical protein
MAAAVILYQRIGIPGSPYDAVLVAFEPVYEAIGILVVRSSEFRREFSNKRGVLQSLYGHEGQPSVSELFHLWNLRN